MDLRYFIKLGVIIAAILVYIYFRKQKFKEENVTRSIINQYKQKSIQQKLYQPTEEEKLQQFEYLEQLIYTLIDQDEANKLLNVIKTRSTEFDSKYNWNISNELVCQEVLNYQFKNNIYLYGYFDVSSESSELDLYIRKNLKTNFDLDMSFQDTIDLSEHKFIHEAFPKYENALNKLGIKLRNIDINSDSYQVVLITAEDYNKIDKLIKSMDMKLQIISP
ncbi:hypothetical protein [Winogradskyella sp. MIT101101]|uniref:DUF6630 family protein n=1 Tax=Winogradskyella sp. MIT101101 TaxID=3098297 RepID=UPI00399B5BF1